MKNRFKLKTRLILYILSITLVIYTISITIIISRTRKENYSDATKLADSYAAQYANSAKVTLNSYLSSTRTITKIFENFNQVPEDIRRQNFADILRVTLEGNPEFLAVWSIWETNSIDRFDSKYRNKVGSTILGNFRYEFYKLGQQIKLSEYIEQDPSQVLSGKLYSNLKQNKKEIIVDPYYYAYSRKKEDEVLLTNIVTPIMVNGQFLGVIGIDLLLESYQSLTNGVRPFEQSTAILVSNDGTIIAHPDYINVGKNIESINIFKKDSKILISKIANGEPFSMKEKSSNGKDVYLSFQPIIVGNTKTPWFFGIIVPVDVIMQKANFNFIISITIGTFGLILLLIFIVSIANNIVKPIKQITSSLKRLAYGELSDDLTIIIKTGDEIEEMSKALNVSVVGLNQKAVSATEIGKGIFDTEIVLLSEKDMLGKSLVDMRDSLKRAHEEEEKRIIDDHMRTWANEGLAKFADILRQNNNDFQLLCDNVIRSVVKYIEANQGGIFLWNEEEKNDPHFELISTFAWDRKKYVTKRIEKGEGLVGACAMEKETIFLVDVPKDYVDISSGLGNSNPRCVILIPLKHEDKVLGVIEMASFKVLEKYKIDFLEKIGESIASTISAVRINARTKALLEQSQQQSEEMSAQEEEMRQNMEELQATQEEAARKTGEIEGLLTALNAASYIVEYDMSGTIINANDAFLHRLGITRQQIIGTHHSGSIEMTDKQKKEYGEFWDDLRGGKSKKIISKINWDDRIVSFIETYYPVADSEGHIYKVMKLSNELDHYKE